MFALLINVITPGKVGTNINIQEITKRSAQALVHIIQESRIAITHKTDVAR